MSLFHPQKTTLHGYYEPIQAGLKPTGSKGHPVPTSQQRDRTSGERIGNDTYHFYDVYHNPIVNTSNENSYDCFDSMMKKGVRNLKGPVDIYRKPMITSQEIGFWTEDAPLERLPWAKADKRFPRVFSEMSKLVSRERRINLLFYFF